MIGPWLTLMLGNDWHMIDPYVQLTIGPWLTTWMTPMLFGVDRTMLNTMFRASFHKDFVIEYFYSKSAGIIFSAILFLSNLNAENTPNQSCGLKQWVFMTN